MLTRRAMIVASGAALASGARWRSAGLAPPWRAPPGEQPAEGQTSP